MSAIRKISLSAAALFIGLSALFFVAAGTASAQTTSIECGEDWQAPPCP